MVDNAGISLPILFETSAAVLLGWALIFGFIYALFCKKYEQRLVQQKERELVILDSAQGQDKSKSDYLTDYMKVYLIRQVSGTTIF